MGNCLVTKLKEVVDNDNLLPIGGIVVGFNQETEPNYSNRHITPNVHAGKTITMTIVGNSAAHFTDSTGAENYGSTITLAAGQTSKTMVSNHTCTVVVFSKYDLDGIILGRPAVVFNIEDFKFAGDGAYFQMSNNEHVTGDVSSLSGKNFYAVNLTNTKVKGDVSRIKLGTSIYSQFNFANTDTYGTMNLSNGNCDGQVDIQGTKISTTTSALSSHIFSSGLNCSNNPNVTGQLSALGTLTACTAFYFQGTSVTGTCESLVEALWTNNKRSGGCYMQASAPITFNNSYAKLLYFIFSDSGVEVRQGSPSGTVRGNYNGSTWTYA